jgi:hypothetical protein
MIHAKRNGDVMKLYIIPNKEPFIDRAFTKRGMCGTLHTIEMS